MKPILVFLLLVLGCNIAFAQPRILGTNIAIVRAGEAIDNWSLVYMSAGKAYKATGTDITKAATAIAIDTAFALNDTIPISYTGILQGFDIEKGKDYYLGTAGAFTATKPTSVFSQKIGTWVGDSTLQLGIQSPLQIINTETFINLASDVSNSTVTLADVTGFSFTAEDNTSYIIKLYGLVATNANTCGIGIVANAPDGATIVAGQIMHNVNNTGPSTMQQVVDNAIAGTTTTNGNGTSGTPASAMNNYVSGSWLVNVVTGGTVTLAFRSEIAAINVTIKAGSKMSYLKI